MPIHTTIRTYVAFFLCVLYLKRSLKIGVLFQVGSNFSCLFQLCQGISSHPHTQYTPTHPSTSLHNIRNVLKVRDGGKTCKMKLTERFFCHKETGTIQVEAPFSSLPLPFLPYSFSSHSFIPSPFLSFLLSFPWPLT